MTLNGQGFHVEVDVLDTAATGIKQSVQDQDNFELRGLCGETDQYGHAPLRDAFMDFCTRWSEGLDSLTDEGEAIGETLSKVADAYRTVDENAAQSLPADPGLEAADG